MRIQRWHLPNKKWVKDESNGLWHSRPRTKSDLAETRQAIADMTFVDPDKNITYNPQHGFFTVVRP